MKHPVVLYLTPVTMEEYKETVLLATGRFYPVAPHEGSQHEQWVMLNTGAFIHTLGNEYKKYLIEDIGEFAYYCIVRLSELLLHELTHWGTYVDDMNPPEWNVIADCSWWNVPLLFRLSAMYDKVMDNETE